MLVVSMEKVLQISKLDAAKRQLETAIRLYFSNSDPISIHTLTAAAYNVIRDINKKRGGKPMLIKELAFDYLNPEGEKIWVKKMNEAENFFKHADRDHGKTLDFRPELNEIYILDACLHYYDLTKEFPPLFTIYRAWFTAIHPDMFKFPDEQARLIGSQAPEIASMGRQAFFDRVLLPYENEYKKRRAGKKFKQ